MFNLKVTPCLKVKIQNQFTKKHESFLEFTCVVSQQQQSTISCMTVLTRKFEW